MSKRFKDYQINKFEDHISEKRKIKKFRDPEHQSKRRKNDYKFNKKVTE